MSFSKSISAFVILGSLSLSLPAFADVAPTDQCFEPDVGKSCPNAPGMDGNRFMDGICQKAMCSRATPDGPMTYDCYRCLPAEGGAGGQSNEGGGGAAGEANGGSGSAGAPINPPGGSASGGAATGGTASGGASSGSGTAGAKTGSSGSSNGAKASDDGGCSVAQAQGRGSALGAALVALGCALAGLRRRRGLAS